MPKTWQDMIAEAKKEIQLLLPDEVKDAIDDGEPLILVDVREPDEWAQGRLPKALHIPRGILELKAPQALPRKDAKIVVYCQGGGRSAMAAKALKDLGYANVGSMEEGFGGWQSRGYPETR